MKSLTIKYLAKKVGVHIDTLFKIKRGASSPSADLAKRLEDETGIDRNKWLYPGEFGNPWDELNQLKDKEAA